MTRNTTPITAIELLRAYHDNVQTPKQAAELFGDDGVIELPTINARAQGKVAIQAFLEGLLKKVPDFRFKNTQVFIETPDKVAAEYSVEVLVPDTGKIYKQTYAGVLIAAGGRIKLLREALDTAEAKRAFTKD